MSPGEVSPDQAPKSTDDRATTFQPLQGDHEHYSGEVLLVSAYVVLWLILLSWVALVWRKQNVLNLRLDDLEREIDKADAQGAAGPVRNAGPRADGPRP